MAGRNRSGSGGGGNNNNNGRGRQARGRGGNNNHRNHNNHGGGDGVVAAAAANNNDDAIDELAAAAAAGAAAGAAEGGGAAEDAAAAVAAAAAADHNNRSHSNRSNRNRHRNRHGNQPQPPAAGGAANPEGDVPLAERPVPAAGNNNNNNQDNNNNNNDNVNNQNNNNNDNQNNNVEVEEDDENNNNRNNNNNGEENANEIDVDDEDGGLGGLLREGGDGIVEGGVAGQHAPSVLETVGRHGGSGGAGGDNDDQGNNVRETRTNSRACDLYVLFENTEKLQQFSSSLFGKEHVIVAIGLENKNTKMTTVFKHFVNFVNQKTSNTHDTLKVEDLEFVHNDILTVKNHETAEGCAIMKGDKIYVRKHRRELRAKQETLKRTQLDSDKQYLKQLRGLFLESVNASSTTRIDEPQHGFPVHAGGPNLVFECRPYLEAGQRGVLNHFIKAHEAIVSKRCPWLKEKIALARSELEEARRRRLRAVVERNSGNHKKDDDDVDDDEQQHQQQPRVVTIQPDVVVIVDSNGTITTPRGERNVDPTNDDATNRDQKKRKKEGGGSDESNVAKRCKDGEEDVPMEDAKDASGDGGSSSAHNKSDDDEDEDDDDAVMHVDNDRRGEDDDEEAEQEASGNQFHQIDDHDEEDDEGNHKRRRVSSGNHTNHHGSGRQSSHHTDDDGNNSVDLLNENRHGDGRQPGDDLLWISSLKHHPPEAVKLLLEYCYTNRVVSLGMHAFDKSSKKGIVAPYNSEMKWPNHGLPTVSMSVTLAGITLAEEARLPRLSLMCEVASSKLINDANVLDALAACTRQVQTTGNRLGLLRKTAMDHLLRIPLLKELGESKKWLKQLEQQKDLVVPALLQGTEEIMSPMKKKLQFQYLNNHHYCSHHGGGHGSGSSGHHSSSSKRKRNPLEERERDRQLFMDSLDKRDKERRRMERANRRIERHLEGERDIHDEDGGGGEGHEGRTKKVDFSDPSKFTWRMYAPEM